MVLNDSVGRRLTISPATTTAHIPPARPPDHQPGPKCSVAYSGRPETSAAAGAGTPTKNSLVYGGWSSASSSVLNRASRSAMHTAKTSATTQPSRRALQRPDVEDERGRDAERDEVRQRVQLGADPAAGVEHPGEPAVERVAQRRDPARRDAQLEPPGQREVHRRQARAQRDDRDGVGQQPHPGRHQAHRPGRLRAVRRGRSRRRSSAAPARRRPATPRQVHVHARPEPDQTRRSRPPPPRRPTATSHTDPPRQQPRDLHDADPQAVARSRSARRCARCPRWPCRGRRTGTRPAGTPTATTRPSTGMRWTCTSSTDRNTLTRGTGARGRSSSAGGDTSPDRRDRAVGGGEHDAGQRRRHPSRRAEERGGGGRGEHAGQRAAAGDRA